jgi:hypothetical protein
MSTMFFFLLFLKLFALQRSAYSSHIIKFRKSLTFNGRQDVILLLDAVRSKAEKAEA